MNAYLIIDKKKKEKIYDHVDWELLWFEMKSIVIIVNLVIVFLLDVHLAK